MQRTKGTHLFALDVVRTQTLTGESAAAVRMVVSVREQAKFYSQSLSMKYYKKVSKF